MRRALMLALCVLMPLHASAAPQGLDQLVDQIREGSREMSKTNQEREARFLRDKAQQAQLLAQAEAAQSAADAHAKQAKARFDTAQAGIAALKQQLAGRVGDSAQIFSAVAEASAGFRAQAGDSLVTPQFPDRLPQLDALAQARELPGVDDIERLWLLLAQEIAEGGKVARFTAQVFDADGAPRTMEVTRIGLFTAFAQGRYLALDPGSGHLAVLAHQPAHTSLAADFTKAAAGSAAAILIDPSRGALLRISAERPSLIERIEQGGAVGYVIIAIGLIGAGMAGFQLVYLLRVDARVRAQLQQLDQPRLDNPLGRVLASLGSERADALLTQDPELLETRLSEAILRETPRLERYQSLIRMIVAAGPLLGLLGTVLGMILTFQVITEMGAGDPKVMAGGISQAMIATVLGLSIAIPLLFANSFLGARSRALTQVLDEQAAGLLARQLEAQRARDHA